MTAKKKITDKNGVQVYPITHTKAVLDDNGNSVEQRLEEQMDLINQKQLEIGAIPSDVAPTAGSTNWVTSGGVFEQTSKIDKLIASAFDIDVTDIEIPTLDVSSAGTGTSSTFGNILTNTDAFELKSVRLYCGTAKNSFIIAIGEADTAQKTYSINHSYTIEQSLTVGENVVDVSEYEIVIPPNALVACTGASHYKGSTGGYMIGAISTTEGVVGTYRTNIANYYMQFVLIGTITEYTSKSGFFKSGENVSEVSIINNFDGGEFDVLSAEQGKALNTQFTELVSSAFNSETVDSETPQVQTASGSSPLSQVYWGTILTNKTTLTLQQVKFYSSNAKTSFKIAIGTANINNNTYHIDNNYTIESSVSVGENIIDVSDYSIAIPPKALVVCTGATHYISSSQGEYLIGKMSSIDAGASGSYNTKLSASVQCVFIGTTKEYNIVIPEDVIKVIGQSNILYGKKYVAIGDSFTARTTAYPHIIGNRNNMTVLNQGVSGSVLNGYISQGKYNQIPQDVDYVTIWYGINDSGHRIGIGTVNDEPENITSETEATTCGGYNWIFKWLLTNRPLSHIGVIITDFCEQTRREAIMACCEKWGIAYLDLYDPTIPMIRTRGNTRYTHDTAIAPLGYVEVCAEAKALRNAVFSTDPSTTNMHPNNTCHEWQSNMIENFMRGL